MSTITELRSQKRRANRYNVITEDGYLFSLSDETIVRHKLKPGAELSEELIEQLRAEDTYKYSNELAAAYLGYAPRTGKQLREHLLRKGIDEITVQRTEELMRGYGYIDDEGFAREYMRSYVERLSPQAICYRLIQKGVQKEVAERVTAEAPDSAGAVMRQLARRYRNAGEDKRKRRLAEAMMRRGFSYSDFNDNYSEDIWED